MRVESCTVKEAIRLVKRWHRHLPDVRGGLFAAKVVNDNGDPVGVGVAGNPSRVWQGTGRVVIDRVATDGAFNACSMLYAALTRAARALGYGEVWTYTLPEEPGTSLKASGFKEQGRDRRRRVESPEQAAQEGGTRRAEATMGARHRRDQGQGG